MRDSIAIIDYNLYIAKKQIMANIMIRNLDDDVKMRLKVRAAQNNRSMEEEVRVILRESVRADQSRVPSLIDIARDAVEPYGGFEMDLPKRDEIRPAFG